MELFVSTMLPSSLRPRWGRCSMDQKSEESESDPQTELVSGELSEACEVAATKRQCPGSCESRKAREVAPARGKVEGIICCASGTARGLGVI